MYDNLHYNLLPLMVTVFSVETFDFQKYIYNYIFKGLLCLSLWEALTAELQMTLDEICDFTVPSRHKINQK